ncbi:MAG: cytochrome c oxidase accessory protein CcoG [Curvibacter sp. RIFCSPHIGHO2_12_FULL_63_18]|uniref:cytochrome c oxidase accessory protein CcoG n=1 Tax=Rhodoferax sp. TaxID=50421 RepID=UPI0008CA3CAA|nr:cytochrome c oxidase accessory protein CcoG [Rhodoferax sp.]OGO93847.1 MAG: cytochrome c oxidase accessory protein CcoG [Curvibacter sp. GWA2_63_95]OGP06730.1 MAG: cytochrome c oxidase accessory protein CcoG [Curvibacter sp. RIFCSPHIGHO2_12_FULL_63_18]HCX80061.1 cytochrome c oxidase accessory protein CcoG [Rhodoferax sp.]
MHPHADSPRKVIPIAASSDRSPIEAPPGAEPEMVALYEAHKRIYPRSVSGYFAKWRWALVFLTQLVFYFTPWLEWGQRQAVLFDLGARRFYIFNLVLYPQDFIYLTGILVISAFSLFLFTAVAGRLWCGYACPQTVYTEIFLWLEKLAEGDRSARMRRDAGPWNWDKVWRKGATQGMWITVALWTGFTFVGYFTPIQALGGAVLQWTLGPWETFWIFFYGFATYGFAGYMREQVCKYMCPYARFQSAMFDKDTLIVTYDSERGEPRGARSKKADPRALNLGACVDCSLCVQVCPTGIDIRKGLQYECIGCGACADVCDSVMDKVGYPRGLVKYSTQNAVHQHWTRSQTLRHVLRPRVLVYVGILASVLVAMGVSLALRDPFKVDVVRDRGTLARIVAGGKMENVYRLQIMNATEQAQEFEVKAAGLDGIQATMDQATLAIGPAQARWVAVRVQMPYEAAVAGSHPFEFVITARQNPAKVVEKSVFIVPR